MDISIGIVGLPNVGKSTLFNSLTKKSIPAENFPFCTIDPNVGVVGVCDKRLEILKNISNSSNVVPSIVQFVDIAGLVKGASRGEGLGNEFLSNIRQVDAIAHVVRCFKDENVIHVDGDINPIRDIDVIETELLLADLQLIERRLAKIERDVKRNIKDAIEESKILNSVFDLLKKGILPKKEEYNKDIIKYLKALGLLTIKPIMYVCNVGANCSKEILNCIYNHARKTNSLVTTVSALTEEEIMNLPKEEVCSIRSELTEADGIEKIIETAYLTLGYISFFTTGEKETRAWAIPCGTMAQKAAGNIHSDFEKNFIRAEVVSYEDFVESDGYVGARQKGLIRLEGKTYIVIDGDVIVFRVG